MKAVVATLLAMLAGYVACWLMVQPMIQRLRQRLTEKNMQLLELRKRLEEVPDDAKT